MTEVPEKVLALAKAVRDAGGRALLVGGCVRDELMGQQPKDWDFEVYGVEPARLRELLDQFGSVNVVGEAFTVYKLGAHLDISLPRRERKTGRGHRAFFVEGDPGMAVEKAAERRDFTINAILQDPLTGDIIDPFRGRDDLKDKTLRAVSPKTFPEDSLRVLRAAQFAARFEFQIDPETVDLCRMIDLTDLPRERIWGEVEKLLLRAQRPSIGLKWLHELHVIDRLFPEINALIDVPQDPEWHPEGDVFIHTLLTVDRARELIDDLPYPKQVTVMLAALAHDFGKPATTEFLEGRLRSREHEEAGVAPTEGFLNRLNVHTIDGYDVRAQVIALVRDHLKPGEFFKKRQIHWAAMPIGFRAKSGTTPKLRNGLSSVLASWKLNQPHQRLFCWAATCWRWVCNPARASARSRARFTRCSLMDACNRWKRPKPRRKNCYPQITQIRGTIGKRASKKTSH
ncbi:MAG: hypothetical protein DMF76_02050 [Acidobacteria bacterium]|nr:MAG: hypothetical protein DMF76_02050 [Acidobacteriota bacterium]